MRIVYIGTKEQKGDNVAQTGLIWKRGEVHEVADPKKAAKLLEHPAIWADADRPYAMTEPPAEVTLPRNPEVHVVPQGGVRAGPNLEPHVIPVPEEIWTRLTAGELETVFMTAQDAESFAGWKRARDEKMAAMRQAKAEKRQREPEAA